MAADPFAVSRKRLHGRKIVGGLDTGGVEVPYDLCAVGSSGLSPPTGERDHLTGQKRTVVTREVAN